MSTKKITLVGKGRWMKLFEDNRDMKGFEGAYEACEGAYTLDLVLDKTNYDILESSGSAKASKLKRKEVELTGETNVKLARKHKDRFDWASGAPQVTKADGKPWTFEDDGPIGNDSVVEVVASVYTTTKAPGTRLESVKILDLVPYERKEAVDADVEGAPF